MIKAVLLDIEGTTTPIDFVYNTLFPFARARMPEYVTRNFAAFSTELIQLRREHAADLKDNLNPPPLEDSPESTARYLNWLADADRKSTALKSVQGKIWQTGYESGALKSPIFEDVPPALKKWFDKKIAAAIYSSGSVLAQKLLFAHTTVGDLTPFINAYFDTETGAKREAESYRKIAAALGFPQVENILFISDTPAELDAARKAGMQTALSLREGNDPIEEETAHRIIQSFAEIAV